MRVISVSEALGLEPGEKIPAIRGVIVKVRDASSGRNDIGPWSIQNIEICDEKSASKIIKVKLFDCDEVRARDKGQTITLESGTNDKRAIVGLELVEDTYKLRDGQVPPKMIEVRSPKGDKAGATIIFGEDKRPPADDHREPAREERREERREPAREERRDTRPPARDTRPPQGTDEERRADETARQETRPPATPAADPKKPKPPHPPVHGQTVGMAIKEAVQLTREIHKDLPVGSRDFWTMVHTYSSDIIRLSDRLGDGWLAPSAKEREAAAAKEKADNAAKAQ